MEKEHRGHVEEMCDFTSTPLKTLSLFEKLCLDRHNLLVLLGTKERMHFFLHTVGSFLLTVKLFYLQLTILAFLLTIRAFLLTILAFSLGVRAFLLTVGKCV